MLAVAITAILGLVAIVLALIGERHYATRRTADRQRLVSPPKPEAGK